VVAIDKSAYRLKLALELGADYALDLTATDRRQRLEAIHALTGGRGADLVAECAGVPEAVDEGLELLRPGGFYIEAGNFSDMGPTTIKPHLICSKSLHILGVGGEAITAYGPSLEAFRRYRRRYPLHKVVSHRYPVEQAEAAIRRSMADDSMKVVIASAEYL